MKFNTGRKVVIFIFGKEKLGMILLTKSFMPMFLFLVVAFCVVTGSNVLNCLKQCFL